MIGNVEWTPSMVEQHIYDILEDYTEGMDTYNHEAIEKIAEYLYSLPEPFQFQYFCNDWPNMMGGEYSLAFVDMGKLYMMGFDYVY